MSFDLAIDVGIPANTDEFDAFVAQIDNILENGCGYHPQVTDSIIERCLTSDLDIATKVVRECRRISRNTSSIRPSQLKWWQTYVSTKSEAPTWPGNKPDKRSMSPLFERRRRKRSMSPLFERRPPQNPPGEQRRAFNGRRVRHQNDRRLNGQRDRRQSPPPENRRNKRRRFR